MRAPPSTFIQHCSHWLHLASLLVWDKRKSQSCFYLPLPIAKNDEPFLKYFLAMFISLSKNYSVEFFLVVCIFWLLIHCEVCSWKRVSPSLLASSSLFP